MKMPGIPAANPRVQPEVILTVKVILITASACGSFGNICTLLAVATNKKLQTIPNAFLVNLAITDFIVCAVLIPCNLLSFDKKLNQEICEFMGYLSLLCLVLSVFSLTLVAVNRYIIICRSRDLYMKIYTMRNTMIMIISSWVLMLLFFSPPFYGFGHFGYNIKFGGCLFDAPDQQTYWFVFIFADNIAMFPTIVLTLFCYMKILSKFRSSRRKVAAAAETTLRTAEVNGETSEHSSHIPRNSVPETKTTDYQKKKAQVSRKKEMAVIKNLFVIWVSFMFNWFPLIVAYKVDYWDIVPADLTHILFSMAQSNSALNFIIYCVLNRQFREAYKRLLTCGRKGNV